MSGAVKDTLLAPKFRLLFTMFSQNDVRCTICRDTIIIPINISINRGHRKYMNSSVKTGILDFYSPNGIKVFIFAL